jgi:hypothetical protein
MTETLVRPGDTRIVVETLASPAGNPALVGLPSFLVGAFALGLYQTNLLSALGSAVPIIMTATAVGLTIAAVWAARLGQNAVASIFGIFAGFWGSYAALVIGLLHGWFGLAKTDVAPTVETFLLSWLFVIGLLTVATLRLPVAFTALFVLVDAALLLLYIGWNQSSDSMLHLGGWAILGFVAVGAYIFVGAMLAELGGKGLPLGDPLSS